MKKKLKILIVDSDRMATPYLKSDLEETYGFETVWLDMADEALETLSDSSFDAMIMCIMMPVPNNWSDNERRKANKGISTGEVLYTKIRERWPIFPIVILSTRYGHSIKNDDFTTVLLKPEYNIRVIVEKIISLVKGLPNIRS